MERLNLFAVAKIIGCFGLKGYVKVQPDTHSLERLSQLKAIFLGVTDESPRPGVVEDVIVREPAVLMKLSGVDTKSAAETLVGNYIFIDEDELQLPKQGSYFTHDIIGCEMWSTDGRLLGIIEDVYKSWAQDLWAVRIGNKLQMIPAVKEFIRQVDIRHRKVVIQIIEGLIEE